MQQQGLVLTVSDRLSHLCRHHGIYRTRAAGTHRVAQTSAHGEVYPASLGANAALGASPQHQQDCTMRRHPPTDSD